MKTKLIEYYNSAKQKSVYYNCAILDPRVSLVFLGKNSKQKNVAKKSFLEDIIITNRQRSAHQLVNCLIQTKLMTKEN